VSEDVTQLVIPDLADEPDPHAERCQAGGRVGSRTARDLDGRTHVGVDLVGGRLVDQLHRTTDHAVVVQERLIGAGEHVDDGVADGDHLEVLAGHGCLPGAHNRDRRC
jgi:hypothetical protein